MKRIALGLMVLVVLGFGVYRELHTVPDLVKATPPGFGHESVSRFSSTISESRAEPLKSEPPINTDTKKLEIAENLSLDDITMEIAVIDKEIGAKNYVARVNAQALSTEEFDTFRKLMRERDDLFKRKISLMLKEPKG